jgi:hypothetical protein
MAIAREHQFYMRFDRLFCRCCHRDADDCGPVCDAGKNWPRPIAEFRQQKAAP